MAKQIVIGHVDVNQAKPQITITYPQFWRNVLLNEGIGHMVVKIDTATYALTAEPVKEDLQDD